MLLFCFIMSDAGDEDTTPSSPLKINFSPSTQKSSAPCKSRHSYEAAKLRRDLYLRQRITTLKNRNQDIQLKVRASHMGRQLKASAKRAAVETQLSDASERRLLYLETVRLKARVFGLHSRFPSTGLALHPRLEIALQISQATCVLKRVEIKAANAFKETNISNHLKWTRTEFLQRVLRKKILFYCVDRVKKSNILNNILSCDLSYSNAVALVSSPLLADLAQLFEALQLPSICETNSYSWVFYGIPLINNYQESLKSLNQVREKNITLTESASSQGQNHALSQFLIILHQVSLRLFHAIYRLCEAPQNAILNPISLVRLKVARSWREYCFFFMALKSYTQLHVNGMISCPLNVRLLKSRDYYTVKAATLEYRQCVLALNWQNAQPKLYQEKEKLGWAQINIDLEKLGQSIVRAGNMTTHFRLSSRLYHLDYDTNDFVLDDHFNQVFIVEKGSSYFMVPPNISTSNWREFWFLKFKQRCSASKTFTSPKTMKTGTNQSLLVENVPFSLHEILELRYQGSHRINEPSADPWVRDLSALDSKLTSLFYRYCDFCFQIREDIETTECIMNLRELQSLYIAKKLGTIDPVMVAVYFRLFLILLAQVVLLARGDSSKIEEVLKAEKLDSEDFSSQLFHLYDDCESQLFVKWFYHCKPNTFHEFILSENIYQLALQSCKKGTLGSSSPPLRFPEFYRYLLLNLSCKISDRVKPLQIITSSLWGPMFESEAPQENAKAYFLSTVFVFIVSDVCGTMQEKWKKHKINLIEIFGNFSSQLWDLCKQARTLIWASCISSMLQLNWVQAQKVYIYYKEDSSLEVLQSQMKSAGATEFQLRYLKYSLSSKTGREVVSMFSQKLLDAFHESSSCGTLVTKNHPHFAKKILHLREQIIDFNDAFYNLYFPLLNWIYFDLGSPQRNKS